MKVSKKHLKQLIKEEVSKVINEMAIDEMAFSMDDLESATADVDATDSAAKSAETGQHLHNLLRNFQISMNNAGGVAVADAGAASQFPPGMFKPYHKNLAIIYKVLGQLAEKMFDRRTSNHDWGPLPWRLSTIDDILRDMRNNPQNRKKRSAQSVNHMKNAFSYLESIIALGRGTADQPAVGFDEPYLSAENADQLENLMRAARTELMPKG